MTVNSPSSSTLQCDTWLWDDMPLNLPGGSTLQCGRWFWGDMPWNSAKRWPYWIYTSGFDFDHITAVGMSFCTSLVNIALSLPFLSYLTLNNVVTLKSGLEVTQGHSNW